MKIYEYWIIERVIVRNNQTKERKDSNEKRAESKVLWEIKEQMKDKEKELWVIKVRIKGFEKIRSRLGKLPSCDISFDE